MLNLFEEFTTYNLIKSKKNENNEEKAKEEEIFKEKIDVNNNNENNRFLEKRRGKISNSKKLISLPKKYQTYTLNYKKKIVKEVN